MRGTRLAASLAAALIVAGLPWALQAQDASVEGEGGAAAKRARAEATARMIDARIDRAITQVGLEPAPVAEDEAIARRLSLDLNGCIPTAQTTIAYMKSDKEDKLSGLIEALLERPEFDRHWANVLASAWIGRKMRAGSGEFHSWLEKQLAARRPYDAIVRDVIAAEGTLDENGAVFYTLRWNTDPSEVAATSARVFMGLQIQCAQCHDHPFTEWKQEQFHHFAAYFGGLQRKNKRVGDQNIPGVGQNKKATYEYQLKGSDMKRSFDKKFLFDFDVDTSVEKAGGRDAVAALMTHPENPFFARMTVNRVWKAMFGRGLVEPAEDLEAQMGYHPMLLSFLASDFVASGYDLRHLVRTIAHSRAYQRSSVRPRGQKDPAADYDKLKDSKNDEKRDLAAEQAQQEVWLFARASIRPLTPEQIAASLIRASVVQDDDEESEAPMDKKYAEKFENLRKNLVRQFDELFGENEMANPDNFDGTIPQTLIMLNGRFVNEAIQPQMGTVMAHILKGNKRPADVVAYIFMYVLSRPPSKAESRAFTRYIQSQGATTQTYVDLMWALINSSEFLMNH